MSWLCRLKHHWHVDSSRSRGGGFDRRKGWWCFAVPTYPKYTYEHTCCRCGKVVWK